MTLLMIFFSLVILVRCLHPSQLCLSKLRTSSLLSLQIPSLSIIAVNFVSGLFNIVNLVNLV